LGSGPGGCEPEDRSEPRENLPNWQMRAREGRLCRAGQQDSVCCRAKGVIGAASFASHWLRSRGSNSESTPPSSADPEPWGITHEAREEPHEQHSPHSAHPTALVAWMWCRGGLTGAGPYKTRNHWLIPVRPVSCRPSPCRRSPNTPPIRGCGRPSPLLPPVPPFPDKTTK
jgi:hypothetical protein